MESLTEVAVALRRHRSLNCGFGRASRTIAPPWFPAHGRAFAAPYADGAVVLATHHEDYFPCPRHDVGH
jgi:hypothetical protein